MKENAAQGVIHGHAQPESCRKRGQNTEPAEGAPGRVWINKTQYFDNVPPEVWGYHIGGFQVCHKYLKDRKGRQLSYDDLTHYQGIVAALTRTIELQAEIDEAIDEWPLL
jgi:hypothetical protein